MKMSRHILINRFTWLVFLLIEGGRFTPMRIHDNRVTVDHTMYCYDVNLYHLSLQLRDIPYALLKPSLKILMHSSAESNRIAIVSAVHNVIDKERNNLPLDFFTQPLEKKPFLLLNFALKKLEEQVSARIVNDIRIRDNYQTLITRLEKKS